MKTSPIILIIALFASISAMAQDVIFFNNGNVIQGNVTQVTQNDISYVRADNPNGPLYTSYKTDVNHVNYQNGNVEYFTTVNYNNSYNNNANVCQRPVIRPQIVIAPRPVVMNPYPVIVNCGGYYRGGGYYGGGHHHNYNNHGHHR